MYWSKTREKEEKRVNLSPEEERKRKKNQQRVNKVERKREKDFFLFIFRSCFSSSVTPPRTPRKDKYIYMKEVWLGSHLYQGTPTVYSDLFACLFGEPIACQLLRISVGKSTTWPSSSGRERGFSGEPTWASVDYTSSVYDVTSSRKWKPNDSKTTTPAEGIREEREGRSAVWKDFMRIGKVLCETKRKKNKKWKMEV